MTAPLSRSALIAVIAVVAASLVVAVVLTLVGDDLGDRGSAGADGYSVSAIGHRGLVRLLEKLDVPVVESRGDSAARARGGLLIVAEPAITDAASRQRLIDLVSAAPRTLIVLPKWYGGVERGKRWLADASLLPTADAMLVLDALDLSTGAELHRASAPDDTLAATPDGGRALAGVRPVIREPQLIERASLAPTIAGKGGILLGHNLAGDVHVLSDPDVLNNFGLRHPENAQLVVRLIDELRDGGPVVIDESMHGYARTPSLSRALFQFPLVAATLQVLVCAVLVVWAAMVRFGPRRDAPPPIAPGKDFLIRNTAALLHYGGHHGHALRRYLALTVAEVQRALHAPALAPGALTGWLERVRAARGVTLSLVELERAVASADAPARVLEVADQVFRWRREMTHGADDRP